jgi:hypothetical protein
MCSSIKVLTRSHSSETNAQASPLLRLPAELRALIFGHVLGTYDIRLSSLTRNLEIRTSRFDLPLIGDAQKSFLNLTLVSRQIYIETAMLPFRLNTWIFDHDSEMCQKGLAQRLLPAQANAIKTAKCRPGTVFHEFWAGPVASWYGIKTFAHLEGLECLVVAIGCYPLSEEEKECMVEKVKEAHGKEGLKVIVSAESLLARHRVVDRRSLGGMF